MYQVSCLVSKNIKEKTHLKACTFLLADMALCISLNTPRSIMVRGWHKHTFVQRATERCLKMPGIQWCVQGFVVDIA